MNRGQGCLSCFPTVTRGFGRNTQKNARALDNLSRTVKVDARSLARTFKRSGSKSKSKRLFKRRGSSKRELAVAREFQAGLQKCEAVTQQEHAITAGEQVNGFSAMDEDKTFAFHDCLTHLEFHDEAKFSLSDSTSIAGTSASHSCCSCSPLEKESGPSQNTPPNCPCASASPYYHSSRIQLLKESRSKFLTALDFDIQASKSTWTEGTRQEEDLESVRERNRKAFEELKKHPEFSPFFSRQEYKLKIDERKIGEGGQAEIYAATGTLPEEVERERKKLGHNSPPEKKLEKRFEKKLVVKVFNEGFLLSDLLKTWSPGWMKEAYPDRWFKNNGSFNKTGGSFNLCWAVGAQLLNDLKFQSRFAFVFPRHECDLRKLIDQRKMTSQTVGPPFALGQTLLILHKLAKAMAWLHELGLLHRDLKASNVLCNCKDGLVDELYIADFESSVGVYGTRFWRAPEILKAVKTRTWNPDPFTREADVYSFAMTGYEVITGLIPLENHRQNNYDVVIHGGRPPLPDSFCSELNTLIRRCWHDEPLKRPPFEEIVSILEGML